MTRATSEQVEDVLHEGPHDWDMHAVLDICRDWLDMQERIDPTTTTGMLYRRIESAEEERDAMQARLVAADELLAAIREYLPHYWSHWETMGDEAVLKLNVQSRYMRLLHALRAYTATTEEATDD
jgi:hypothetical protein